MRRVALRGLLARRTRLALTALAVALGVTLIAGTYVFTDTINSSFDRIFTAAYKSTDVVVTPDDDIATDSSGDLPPIPGAVVRRIRGLGQVAQVDGSVFDQNGKILDAKGKPISGNAPTFIGSIHDVRRFETFQVAKGHLPTGPDEVALDKSTADRKHFTVGGTVDVLGQTPRKRYRVAGLVTVQGVDSYGGASVALMTLREAQRVTGKVGAFDQVDVAATAGTSPDALAAAVRRVLPRRYDVRTGAQQASKQTSDIRDNLGFLQTALLAFAGICLFVGAFIIFNTFSITVAQRAREFALLRTLGADRRQVLASVLTEGLLLGLLGSAVGLGAGVLVAKGLKALFTAFGIDLPAQGTVLEARTVIVSLLVGVVVTMISCVAPALRATRVPPVAALREGVALPQTRSSRLAAPLGGVLAVIGAALIVLGLTATSDTTTALSLAGGGAAAVFVGVALLSPKLVPPLASVVGRPLQAATGVTGRLARENAVRQPGRTAVTAAALMIGVALVSFASIFADSAKSTIAGYVDRGLRGDAVVQDSDNFSSFSARAADAVKRVDGVSRVASVRFGQGRVNGKKTQLTAVDPGSFTQLWNVTRGERVLRGLRDDEVAVDKDYASDHHVRVGQTLVVRAAGQADVALRVAGIVEDKADLLDKLTVTTNALRSRFSVGEDGLLLLGFARGRDPGAVKAAVSRVLDRDYPQLEALTAKQFKDDQADQIDQVLNLIYALLALAIIVAIFGIVNTLVLSVTERTRELGMLRAIGTSRRQVRRVIRYESVITATIGGLLGLALGVVLALLLTRAVDEIQLTVPVGRLVVLLVLSALVGLLAAALPARRAARLDVLRALAHE